MKNLKDIVTNICGLIIAVSGGLITIPLLYPQIVLPQWVFTASVIASVVALAVNSWAQGKNPNLTNKTQEQVDKANSGNV